MQEPVPQVEAEMALLLRLADRNRRSPLLDNTLERSAYLVLQILENRQPANISAIADALRLDASTVTRQVVAMETAALVERQRDPADGRGTLVVATPHGLAELASTRRARTELYGRVLARWSADERHELATLLHRFNSDLDSYARGR
jgi:DNA-binding MarR family transcriptional regulator